MTKLADDVTEKFSCKLNRYVLLHYHLNSPRFTVVIAKIRQTCFESYHPASVSYV